MKSIQDRKTATQMAERVKQLTADQPPLWGTMTAAEMLLHCNKIQEQLYTPAPPSDKKDSVKQVIIRLLMLYVIPNFPKNVRTPKHLRTKGTIDTAAFEEQKTRFINNILHFPDHKEPITHRHPYFGNLNTHQWGIASWKHYDHHLRQFGV